MMTRFLLFHQTQDTTSAHQAIAQSGASAFLAVADAEYGKLKASVDIDVFVTEGFYGAGAIVDAVAQWTDTFTVISPTLAVGTAVQFAATHLVSGFMKLGTTDAHGLPTPSAGAPNVIGTEAIKVRLFSQGLNEPSTDGEGCTDSIPQAGIAEVECAFIQRDGYSTAGGITTTFRNLGPGFTNAIELRVGQTYTATISLGVNGFVGPMMVAGAHGDFSHTAEFFLDPVGPAYDYTTGSGTDYHSPSDLTVTAAVVPPPNAAGWNTTATTIDLTAATTTGGVKQITYSMDGAQTIPETVVSGSTASAHVTGEGTSTLTFFATDTTDQPGVTQQLTVNLDFTRPVLTAVRSPQTNANGWNTSPVTVTFTCTDALSGVASVTPTGPTVFTAAGTAQSVSATCTDIAGNVESLTIRDINIDPVAPQLQVTTGTPFLWSPNGSTVRANISGQVSDALSGLDGTAQFSVVDEYGRIQPAGTIAVNPSGSFAFTVPLQASRLDTDADGRQYRVVVTVKDGAGNTTSGSALVVVPHDQRK
jgi:hypothetical protein